MGTSTQTTPASRSALQRRDGEGGAVARTPASSATSSFDDAELVQLRMRVVALEGIVLALLAHGSGPQRSAAARMAGHILPRMGATPHPLTIRAARRITQLVDRAHRLNAARGQPIR